MVRERYDIVIVGAGPGGCMATLHSAGRVLLVEKKKEIGVPVRCAEGLFGKAVDFFDLYDYVEDAHVVHNVEFNFPDGRRSKIKIYTYDIYIINKAEFLRNMLHEAVRKDDLSLTIRTNTKASYKNGRIILNGRDAVEAKVIIAADGVNSNIGKATGMVASPDPGDVYVCAQYKLKGSFDPDAVRLFLDKPYAPGGYAWVFPKGRDIANVGLAVQGSRHIDVKKQLDWFVGINYPDAEKMDFFRAPVCLGPPARSCVRDNIMLVGDAARYTLSPSGAGIGNALFSGKAAGITAAKHLTGEWHLRAYENMMIQNLYGKLKKGYRLKRKLMKDRGAKKFFRILRSLLWLHRFAPKLCEGVAFRNLRF